MSCEQKILERECADMKKQMYKYKFYGQENKKGFRDLNIFTQQALLHSDRTRIASSNSGHPTIFNEKNKIKEDRVLLYLTKHYLL
jgi:hypothetical protein